MLDKKVAELINNQINKEFYSAYLYLDFSVYYEEVGLDGFANWYMIQAQEAVSYTHLEVCSSWVTACFCGNSQACLWNFTSWRSMGYWEALLLSWVTCLFLW